MEVKTAAHLEAIQMPEVLRIPEELDSDEKKILELQRRLIAIQAASPDLKVTFENKKSFLDFKLFKFSLLTTARMADELQKARQEYPKTPLVPNALDFSLITNKQVEQYNGRIATYLENLSLYHNQINDAAAWYNRTAEIKLFLSNMGGSPAEDIDILIHIPDGMEVVDEEELPEMSAPPDPPGTFADAMARMFAIPNINISALHSNFKMPLPPDNAQLLDIKKTKSYDVKFHVERLKHQNQEQLPLIYLHFSSEPMSFRAEYRIVAANVPEPVIGALDLIYKGE